MKTVTMSMTSMETEKGYWKEDPLFKDYTYEEKGQKEGYIKEDSLSDDRYNVYDKNGEREGYWKKDPLFEDRYDYKD